MPLLLIGKQSAKTGEDKMNALTQAAKRSIRKEVFENYTIAVICGIVLGLMLGYAI